MTRKTANKFLSLALAVLMIPALLPVSALAAEGTYSDMSDHWAESAIERWSEYGVLQGSDGLFRPDNPITREEAAVMIGCAFDVPENSGNENSFPDAGEIYKKPTNEVEEGSVFYAF